MSSTESSRGRQRVNSTVWPFPRTACWIRQRRTACAASAKVPAPGQLPMSLVTELAEHAHSIARRAVPDPVSFAAKAHLMDTVGALLAGYATLHGRAELLVEGLGLPANSGPGAPGNLRRTAFLGGLYAHCWEVDDMHREAVLCPGCVVLPATLAVLDILPALS